MPRTNIPLTTLGLPGNAQLTETNADQANGMSFVNAGDCFLVVHNGDGSSRTVTVGSVAQPPLGRTGDVVRAVAASARAILGPFRVDGFCQADGTVNVDFSVGTTTAVKVSLIKVQF